MSLSPRKKSSSSISSRALIAHTDGANIFFAYSSLLLRTYTGYGCKLKATVTRRIRTKNHLKMTQEPLHDRLLYCQVLKTLRAIVFLKLISFLEDSKKTENRSQLNSNCQWLIYCRYVILFSQHVPVYTYGDTLPYCGRCLRGT